MFDAYHKWLGIPPAEQPPTYYRLLGISPAEQDREVIAEAALRQTAHVRTYQIGQHAAEATRLLNEIAKARTVLTNPAKKLAYDAQLQQGDVELEPSVELVPPPLPQIYQPAALPRLDVPPVPSVGSAWDMSQAAEEGVPLVQVGRKRKRSERNLLPWVVVLSVIGIGIAIAVIVALTPDGPKARDRSSKKKAAEGVGRTSGDMRPVKTKEEEPDDAPESTPFSAGEGWDKLFNGKDLAGWKGRLQDVTVPVRDTFKVGPDGTLTCTSETRGQLETLEKYKDFDLRLEYRFPPQGRTEPRYSSAGIVFRTVAEDAFNAKELLEVSLGLKDAGNFRVKAEDFVTAKGSVNPANKEIRRATKTVPARPGRWNPLELSVIGPKVTLKINGQVVNEGTGAPEVTAPLRLIYRGTEIQFRNVAIKRRD